MLPDEQGRTAVRPVSEWIVERYGYSSGIGVPAVVILSE